MDADKYRGRYRIASARLATWDYGRNAAYFVTICTHRRIHAFGTVAAGQVGLSPLGQAAWDCWDAIPEHFPFVRLGAFVAMPNHVHGIVIIDKPASEATAGAAPILTDTQPSNRFGPQSQNLASIVRGYKIGVTKYARQHQIEFAWQARYYDSIVRDAADYQRISTYIAENPEKWSTDRLNS